MRGLVPNIDEKDLPYLVRAWNHSSEELLTIVERYLDNSVFAHSLYAFIVGRYEPGWIPDHAKHPRIIDWLTCN